MKLISMQKFVMQQNVRYANKEITLEELQLSILNYAVFLGQPLTLGMFVPCDVDGNVLEEVKCNKECESCDCMYEHDLYQEAKDRVLFEGFHSFMNNVSNGVFELSLETFWFSESQESGIVYGQSKIIEDLIGHDLVLTESAKKQIGILI